MRDLSDVELFSLPDVSVISLRHLRRIFGPSRHSQEIVQMNIDTQLARASVLPFELALIDGRAITTVGQAADYLSVLSEERRQKNHWRLAIRMLDAAFREPAYLKAASMSLQTALVMDGLLSNIVQSIDHHVCPRK